jgi:transcriptional regulator with XRE-family HTH domain
MDIKRKQSALKKEVDALFKLTIGELLRSNRQKKGLKVYELAKLVKVNPVYITQIEKNYKLPSVERFIKIITILKPDFPTYFVLDSKFKSQKFPGYDKMLNLFADFTEKNFPDLWNKTVGNKP